jgi:hypothetical protein
VSRRVARPPSRRRAALGVAAVLCCAASCADPPAPKPAPVLRVGSVPPSETTPLRLPRWDDGELAPASDWPRGCDLFKESDATRIVPQTSHQTLEEFDLQPPIVRAAGSAEVTHLPLPRGECRRELWFAGTQPGDYHDAMVWVSPLFAGGAALARVNYQRWAEPQPCPAAVDRRVVSECSFDPAFGDYLALRNGVVVTFNTRTYIEPRGRWEGQSGDGDDAYQEFWQQEVAPRFVNAVMARIP